MKYMSVKEAAEMWNISVRRVQVLCEQNRIPGCAKVGRIYVIPKTATKPSDARFKENSELET